MNETTTVTENPSKGGKSKKIISLIIVLLLIAGGSIAAYAFLKPTDKESYFLAEKDTLDFIKETLEERYAPEAKWKEQKKTDPVNTELELSAEYNDPYGYNFGIIGMINNASFTIETTTDKDKKEFATELGAQFAGVNVDGFKFFLTDDRVMTGLPFLDDVLQIKSDDLPSLLHELDPDSFTGEEEYNFGSFFDGAQFMTESFDMDHFKKEYAEMIYEELPDSAFAIAKENVNVQNNSLKTEKITMHLSEKELKSILNKTISTMQQDKVLKEMIRDQLHLDFFSNMTDLDQMPEEFIDDFINGFDDGLDEMKSGISDLEIPNGLTSTIWVKDDVIVKRDFSLDIGPSSDKMATISIKGEQLLGKEEQSIDYTVASGNDSLTIKGDLSSSDGKINDSIKLATDTSEISYESDETLKDGTREYERIISTDGSYGELNSLIWSGEAMYDNDQMSSENSFAIESPDLSQDTFQLHVSKESKTVKEVDIPSGDNVKDIGGMDIMELNNYFEMDVAPKAEQWIQQIMGGGIMNGGF
ncbi:MAG TPA: DUF6583 family protein [Bacillota bacterium]|nr:DUF6583 family protein [Bacillota bacterium]